MDNKNYVFDGNLILGDTMSTGIVDEVERVDDLGHLSEPPNQGDIVRVISENKEYVYISSSWVALDDTRAMAFHSNYPGDTARTRSNYEMSHTVSREGQIDCENANPPASDNLNHAHYRLTFDTINIIDLLIVLFAGAGLIMAIWMNKTEIGATLAGGILGYLSKTITTAKTPMRH